MRKIMAFILIVVMCVGLTACGVGTPDLNKDGNTG